MRNLLLCTLLAITSVPAMPAERAAAKTSAAVEASIEIGGPVLMVTNLERSLKFYVAGLGLQVATRLPGNPGPGAIVTAPGRSPTPFLLIRQSAADPSQAPPVAHGNALSRVMLVVPDSAAVAARLTRAGFLHEPVNSRGIFFVKDPDGFSYEIMQRDFPALTTNAQ